MFHTPAASHHGGVWERCIRSVRKVLNAVTHLQTQDEESLVTFMCEVENINNDRPLTCVSSDVKDMQPLTPNMLFHQKQNISRPPGEFDSSDLFSRKRWRHVQYLSNIFWKQWVKEYLPLLQKRQKCTKTFPNFFEGDLVLIASDNLSRNARNLGLVIETKRDKNGLVRSAKIKTATALLDRPITKL